MDLGRMLAGANQVLQGIGDAAIIDAWLEMDDQAAFAGIEAQVSSSSTHDVDRLDNALLTLAVGHYDPTVRRRLAKFYAMFKMVELTRYGAFRGFPQ